MSIHFDEITKAISYIKKMREVLNQFYSKEHSKVQFLDNLERQLKNGMVNLIKKKEIKDKIDKIKQMLPDLEKKYILKLLFEQNWIINIDKRIIKECYKAIRGLEENLIEKELILLKKYFNFETINDIDIKRIKDEIIGFSKKEEIIETVNSCLSFISELKAIPTDFSSKLKEIRNTIIKCVDLDKIKECGHSLEKYGINILNQKREEKDYLNILNALYNTPYFLQLIVKLPVYDSDWYFTFLDKKEFDDIEKCSNFMKKVLGVQEIQKNDKDLISSFIKEVPKVKNISGLFIDYTNYFARNHDFFLRN